jgi:hypothetical protein
MGEVLALRAEYCDPLCVIVGNFLLLVKDRCE